MSLMLAALAPHSDQLIGYSTSENWPKWRSPNLSDNLRRSRPSRRSTHGDWYGDDWYGDDLGNDDDDLLYGDDDDWLGAAPPHEFDSDTPDGVQLVRVYRGKDGNWPNRVATPDGYVYVYADGVQAVEKELPPPAGTIYHQVYAIFHPAVAPSFGWVRWVSPILHSASDRQERRSIKYDIRHRGQPKFPGEQYREVKDPYGPGMIREENPAYRRWHENVYTPWVRKNRKETRWWKKTPEGKKFRAETKARFRQYRRSKRKTKLREARSKKRKGLFKKARKKADVWWRKQRLKLVPKASKKWAARLRKRKTTKASRKHERRAERGAAYSPHTSSRRGRYGAVVPFDNDDGTWLVFGALGMLAGIGFIF